MLAGIHVQGTAAQTGVGSNTVLAAAGAANRYHIDRVLISINTHQDTGLVSVSDGATVFVPSFLAKDDNGSLFCIDFGPYGWVSELNATISIVVEVAAVGCACTVIGRRVEG